MCSFGTVPDVGSADRWRWGNESRPSRPPRMRGGPAGSPGRDLDPLDRMGLSISRIQAGIARSVVCGGVAAGHCRGDDDQYDRDRDGHDPAHPVDTWAAVAAEGGVDEPADDHTADAA